MNDTADSKNDSAISEMEDSIEDAEQQHEPKLPATRRRPKYAVEKTFENKVDADKFMQKEKCWAVKRTTETSFIDVIV